jgi:hypothetical protein
MDFQKQEIILARIRESSASLLEECRQIIASKIDQARFSHVVKSAIQYIEMLYEAIETDPMKSSKWPTGYLNPLTQLPHLRAMAASQIYLYLHLIHMQVLFFSNWNYRESFLGLNLKTTKNNMDAIADLILLLFLDENFDGTSLVASGQTIVNILHANKMTTMNMKELHDQTDELRKDIDSFYRKMFTPSEMKAVKNDRSLKDQCWKRIQMSFNRNNLLRSLAELFLRFKMAENRLVTYDPYYNPSLIFFDNLRALIIHLSEIIEKEVTGTFIRQIIPNSQATG